MSELIHPKVIRDLLPWLFSEHRVLCRNKSSDTWPSLINVIFLSPKLIKQIVCSLIFSVTLMLTFQKNRNFFIHGRECWDCICTNVPKHVVDSTHHIWKRLSATIGEFPEASSSSSCAFGGTQGSSTTIKLVSYSTFIGSTSSSADA